MLLDLNRLGLGDKSLHLWIDGALDAPSGVSLLERLVAEHLSGDSLDLDFLLRYHCDWELDFLIPFSSDSN